MACNPPAQPAAPRAIPAPEESTSGGGLIGSGPKAIVAGVPMPAEVAGVELIEAVEVIAMRVLEFVRVMSFCASVTSQAPRVRSCFDGVPLTVEI